MPKTIILLYISIQVAYEGERFIPLGVYSTKQKAINVAEKTFPEVTDIPYPDDNNGWLLNKNRSSYKDDDVYLIMEELFFESQIKIEPPY